MSPDSNLALNNARPSTLPTIGFSLLVLTVLFLGTRGTESTASKAILNTPSSSAPLNACNLINNSEIASLQGLPVQQAEPTSQKRGDLNISQCYYPAISADGSQNLSVFIQLIQRDPQSTRRDAVMAFWSERFARERTAKGEAEDEDEAINPPRPVPGVGDDAFWLGSDRGGALFVLQKGSVVRITVGGADDAKTQLEKTKMLAKKALMRLM